VVVATSTDPSDDIIVSLLQKESINYVRGPLNDVLERFVLAVKDLPEQSIVVRLTADNLFPDGEFINEIVCSFIDNKLSYLATNSPIDGLPYGLSAEVFTVEVLRKASRFTYSGPDREHVTPWIRRNYSLGLFKPARLKNFNLNHLRCTLDTLDDYLRLQKVFAGINDPVNTPWYELVDKLSTIPGEPTLRVPFKIVNETVHSKLTLGTAQLGMTYGAANITGQPSDSDAKILVREAIKHGITNIDTARAYGDAERRLGEALADGYAGRATVITKLNPCVNIDSKTSATLAVEASVFRSCRELGASNLNVLLLHRWSQRFSHNETIWKRLIELKQEGVIRKLGVSVQSPGEMLEALEDPEITHVQLPFNILDWRWKAADIERVLAKRQDVVIHARSVLLQGILPADASFWPRLKNLDANDWINKINLVVSVLGRQNIKDLCYAYTLAQPWITSIVVGMENMKQLNDNILLLQKDPLTPDECSTVESMLASAPEELLNPSLWE